MTMSPIDMLLNFAQTVIPIALAVPALVAFRSKEWEADQTLALAWYIPLIVLILAVVGILVHVGLAGPVDLISFLTSIGSVVITLLLLIPYARVGQLIVDYQTSEVIKPSPPSPVPSA